MPSELSQDRRAWVASVRDVVNAIGDAGATHPRGMPTHVSKESVLVIGLHAIGLPNGTKNYALYSPERKGPNMFVSFQLVPPRHFIMLVMDQ